MKHLKINSENSEQILFNDLVSIIENCNCRATGTTIELVAFYDTTST